MRTCHVSVGAAPGCIVSFGAVKATLEELGFAPEYVDDPRLLQSLRLIYPLNEELATSVRSASASLTDAATSTEQIRFFQHQRTRRSFIKLARAATERHGRMTVHVSDCHRLDAPSREFFHVAATICGWSVSMGVDASAGALRHSLPPAEQRLLELLATPICPADADAIRKMALDYLNAGDAWTAVAIGRRLQDVDQSSRVWNLLAVGYAMLQDTFQAEFCYEHWASTGLPLDKVQALYGKSMLYARHHPAGLRSLDISEDLLNEAYAIITTLGEDVRSEDSVIFDEVFNRNGYALTLFRRRRVEEATATLRWGIAALTATSERIAIHRTVLMYNLAQCLKALGDLPGAIEGYRELLAVDPYMPEYHLEFAKCLAATGEFASAKSACCDALALDDTLAPAWSLLGVYEGELDDHQAAAAAHQQASVLDPDTPTRRTDVAYHLVRDGQLRQAQELLADWNDRGLPQQDVERRASLLAEVHLRQDQPEAALSTIHAAMERCPASTVLTENRDAIYAMISCS